MRKILALAFLFAACGAAVAADNTLLVTPCATGCITTRSKDVGSGVQAPMPILSDASGTAIYGTAGTANANVLTVQGIASMTPLLVTLSAETTKVIGTVNQGTSPWVVSNSGTFAVQAAQTGTWNVGNTAGTARIGYVSDDPCTQLTKTNLAISTATGTTQLVAPSGSTQVYVCSFSLISAATAVVNLVGGTGATCTTGTPVAALGSTTAANGASLAANGGLTFGNGGATALRTTTGGHGLCLIQSGTTALAGNITYVQQ